MRYAYAGERSYLQQVAASWRCGGGGRLRLLKAGSAMNGSCGTDRPAQQALHLRVMRVIHL